MVMFASLFILAFAVSLDGFAVGMTYGLRKIRIPFASVAIISVCSGLVIFASMQLGKVMMRFLSETTAERIGACLLIGIGTWALFHLLRDRKKPQPPKEAAIPSTMAQPGHQAVEKRVVRIEIKTLGLVIEILKHPAAADVDRSGNISPGEAAVLGIALSLDAFGAGLGAALIGLSPWITPVVIGLSSGLLIVAGLQAGAKLSRLFWMRRLVFLPGMILIAMGIMKLV